MEQFKEGEFSGWDNVKFPLLFWGAVALVCGGIVLVVTGVWDSL